MTSKLISKDRVPFNSLFWSGIPYISKIKIQKYNDLVDQYCIEYSVDNRKLHGLIIEPKDKSKKYPVIIFNRGGNNIHPQEVDFGTNFANLSGCSCYDLASKGYVIYTTQLSGYGENSGKDEFGGEDLNDILALKDFIDSDSLCDSNRIGMLGYSRGGLMAYNILTKVDWIKAVATVGAPTNLFRDAQDRPEMLEKVYNPAFGAIKKEMEERSIVFNVDKLYKSVNILIQHGKKDWRVNQLDAIELAEKLKESNINHKLIIYPEDDHGITSNRKQRDQEILNWFNNYL